MKCLVVFMFCICLKWPEPAVSMPAFHGYQKHGVLDSISHCTEDQRKDISHQLEQTFKSELPSSDMTLPPTQTSIQVFLYVTYDVFNTKITKFALESAEFMSENSVPAWKINRASVRVEGGYRYSHTFSSDSGTYDLRMDHVKMYMIGNKCQIDLGQPNKVFSGSTANWGYNNYIKGTSKDDDNKDLKEKLCHYMKKIFHDVLSRSTCLPKTTTTIAPSTQSVPAGVSKSMNEEPKPGGKTVPERRPSQESDKKPDHESGKKPDAKVEGSYNRNPDLPRLDSPFDEKKDKKEGVNRPNLKPYPVTKSASPSKEELFPNDEPLDIPGFLPYVDPKGEGKGLWSPSSASTHPVPLTVLVLSAFVIFCIGRVFSCRS